MPPPPLHTPFLTFLGDLVHKGNALCIYTSVVLGGCVSTLALLDSAKVLEHINLISEPEVAKAMLSLGKPLQVETCNIDIITSINHPSRNALGLTLPSRKYIYICILDTEPLLIGVST